MNPSYVFDLDGTLVDSMSHFGAAMTGILDDAGISYGEDLVKTVTPLGYRKTAEYYVNTLGIKDSVDGIVAEIERRLYTAYSEKINLKPGIEKILRTLKEHGARLFVLTASPHLVTDACLKANGVYDWFEKVWSVEDFALTKSDARIFRAVAKEIGCSMHEVHYFDDNVIAVTNARAAGFYVFGIKDLQSAEELATIKANAHIFIENFTTIPEDIIMETKKIIPTAEDVARVKGLGFLRDKTTEDCFNARVITRNGKVSASNLEAVAEASRLFGSGEVTLTSRMSFEVQRIPYSNIEPFCAYLSERGMETGGTGPKVRPIVSCKGTTCQYGLIDTFSLAEKIHERFYKGYHSVKLPHKFKIAVGGCPNNCVKPDINDLGIIGQRIPAVDPCKCHNCKICKIEQACSIKLARIVDGKIYIDPDRCNHCGRCVGKCPFGAVEAQTTGYRVTVGGRWGKQVARGRALDHICTSEDEVLSLAEKCILLFRDKGEAGERFADTIERLGFEKVQALLASDALLLRKDEILADKE